MLSLIAIAKNEAAEIQEFLRHHKPLADEMVVVDTGSSDETAELAHREGARVLTFDWCDDFAAARNFSLEAARGDWVIALDTDERIAPQDFQRLRKTTEGEPLCYMLPQWNYYDRPAHQEWQPVLGRYPDMEKGQTGFFIADQYRLLAVLPGLRWEGCVHEDMAGSMARLGIAPHKLDVVIHHYGYAHGVPANQERNEFYGRLVRKKAAANPEDPKAALELAYILIQEGRGRESLPILEKWDAQPGGGPIQCRVRSILAKLYAEDHRLADAQDVLGRMVSTSPQWIFGWTSYLQFLSSEKRYDEATAVLARAKKSFPENILLLQEEFKLLVNTEQIVAAIPLGRRISALAPHLPQYAELAAKCEDLARRAGLL